MLHRKFEGTRLFPINICLHSIQVVDQILVRIGLNYCYDNRHIEFRDIENSKALKAKHSPPEGGLMISDES